MFKTILVEYLLRGILWGCTILVGNILFYSITGANGAYILLADFPRMVLGFILFGVGISAGTRIYYIEKLNIFVQSAIHAIIFFCFLLLNRFISFGAVIGGSLASFVADMAIAFLIFTVVGFGVYQYHKAEVREMNEALRKREEQNK
jgi:hypothetical protein